MSKITFILIVLLVKFSPLMANLQTEIEANNSKIEELERTLAELVERQNELIAKQAGKFEPSPHVDKVDQKNNTTKSSIEQRIETLEQKVQELEQALKLKQNERTPSIAEIEATQKAQANAPLLPEANSKALAQYDHAILLLQTNNPDKAKIAAESFKHIIETFPTDPIANKARVHLGDALKIQKEYEQAKKAYEDALSNKLDDLLIIEAYLGYMEACQALNQKEALKAHMHALKALKLKYDSLQQERLKALQ